MCGYRQAGVSDDKLMQRRCAGSAVVDARQRCHGCVGLRFNWTQPTFNTSAAGDDVGQLRESLCGATGAYESVRDGTL